MERRLSLVSKHFGEVDWDPASEILMPSGLPGFEDERRMVAVEIPAQRPLVFLQSAEKPEICFVTLPIRTIKADYELTVGEEDRTALRFEGETQPEIGTDVLCLALLFPSHGSIETNLAAPVVVNLHNLRCVQLQESGTPACRYRLDEDRWVAAC